MIELTEQHYTYINYFLIALIILSIARRLFFSKDDQKSELRKQLDASKTTVFRDFTPRSLAKFNGENNTPVLLAIKGEVFDVSAGRSFYGPGGPYSNFAGHDASRGLAKSSFDDIMITPLDQPIDTLDDLTEEEKQTLDDWFDKLSGKYLHVGKLVPETAKTK